MWLSLVKKMNKYRDEIKSIENIPNLSRLDNREIQLDTLTPQIANQIDELIRFWNKYDEEFITSLGSREPIKIYINSIGGSLDAAITIMNSIRLSRTPVYTFNTGRVCKESFLVYLAGTRRYSYPDALFMYTHTMLPIIQEEEDNESTFYSLKAATAYTVQNLKSFFLERVSITEAQYDKHCKNDWWFSTDDAFKIHIVNEICRTHFNFIPKKN